MAYKFGGATFATHLRPNTDKGYDLTIDSKERFKPKRSRGRVWDLPPPVKCYGFPDQARGYFQNTGFLSSLELLFEDAFASTHYLGPLREYPARQYTWAGSEPSDMGQRGEAVVAALLSARRRGPEISMGQGIPRRNVEQHVADWLERLRLVRGFNVEEIAPGSNLYRVKVKTNYNSAEVLLTEVGFGVSQVLPVLTLAFYVPEGSTVILEQPELHLHPGVQAGLADVLIDAVKRRRVQIILESHSEHLLLRLQRRIAEGQLAPSDAAIYFCDRPYGRSAIKRLEIDESGHIKNWPANFFGDTFGDREAIMNAALQKK